MGSERYYMDDMASGPEGYKCEKEGFARETAPQNSSAGKKGEINQCDGCQRGLPLRDGDHYSIGSFTGLDKVHIVMGCTKNRYKEKKCCYYCNKEDGEEARLIAAKKTCCPNCKRPFSDLDDWETKEREAFNEGFSFRESRSLAREKVLIANYWLYRIRFLREEAVSAYKQELEREIRSQIQEFLPIEWSTKDIYGNQTREGLVKMIESRMLALLSAP